MKEGVLYIVIILSGTYSFLFAQWQPDVRLTYDGGSSWTAGINSWCIATDGLSMLHVVWEEGRDGNLEAYYKRSTDAGENWEPDIRLTDALNWSKYPSIAASGDSVHVVWYDYRDGGEAEIYHKRSIDAGVTWSADTRLTNTPYNSYLTSIAVSSNLVHVVWQENLPDTNSEIYYKCSTDAGQTWGPDVRLTNDLARSARPCIAVSGNLVHVIWSDSRDANYEIYYKCSTDAGQTWGPDVRLTNELKSQFYPSVAVSRDFIHVVWSDVRDGGNEIYYKRSTDGGLTWGTDIRLTINLFLSIYPSVAASGLNVHVVWYDNRDGNTEIYYRRSTDAGENWEPDIRLTNDTNHSYFPSPAILGDGVHVVWTDDRDGNYEIYYKRNPTGNAVVEENFRQRQGLSFPQITPSVFKEKIRIRFAEFSAAPLRIILYNVYGTSVFEKSYAHTPYLLTLTDKRLADLSAGVYFLSVVSDMRKLGQVKLIKP